MHTAPKGRKPLPAKPNHVDVVRQGAVSVGVGRWWAARHSPTADYVRPRRRRKQGVSAPPTEQRAHLNVMVWNARGIEDDVVDVIDLMEERKVTLGCFMETKIFSKDLSRGRWQWFGAAEHLPTLGDASPRLGLGMFVDTDTHTGATPGVSGRYTMWLLVPGEEQDLYICAVYVPVYPMPERAAAWRELGEGYARYKDLGLVIMCGDMNSRCGMNGDPVLGPSGRQLLGFCSDRELVIVNALVHLCKGQFTRVQGLEKSTIDYVLVPSVAESTVLSLEIVSDSGLRSDHRPLVAQTKWQAKGVGRSKRARRKARHFKWRALVCAKDKEAFEACAEEELVRWAVDFESFAASVPVGMESEFASSAFAEWLVAFNKAASRGVGKKKVGGDSKPWVDRGLLMLWEERRQATKRIRAAGGVTSAERDALVANKECIHAEIKIRKKEAENKLYRQLEAAPSSRLFWSQWKAHTKAVGSNGGAPMEAVDENGELVTDKLAVLRVWRSFVEKLGTADVIPADPGDRISKNVSRKWQFDDDFARAVLARLRQECCDQHGSVPELEAEVQWDEVLAVLNLAPSGKSADLDNLNNDLLRAGGVAVATTLTELFNYVWKHLAWPDQWQRALMVALYKGDGDKRDPGNHRMLSIMSVVAKTFEKVIDNRVRKWSERTGALSDLQGGFRGDRGCVDQIFLLNELTGLRTERKLCTYLTFVDVRKAYDRVWRPGLFLKLKEMGLGGKVSNVIEAMFQKVVRTILIDGALGEDFEVHAGVPQGSVLSPYLYAVYINGLHQELRDRGLGVRAYGRLVPLLLYADDIVLLARDAQEMKEMHRVLDDYARKWRFEVNHGKTSMVVVGSTGVVAARKQVQELAWTLCGSTISLVEEYKYLGVEMGAERGKWNSMLERRFKLAQVELNLTLWRGGGACGLRPRTFVALWQAKCRPLLEYGAEVWEGDGVSNKWVDKLERLQYTFAKAVLRLKGNPSAVGLRAELGLSLLQSRRQELKLRYWRKLCRADSSRLLSLVFRNRYAEAVAGQAKSSCLQSFKTLFSEYGLSGAWLSGPDADLTSWDQDVHDAAMKCRAGKEDVAMARSSSLTNYVGLGHRSVDGVANYLDDTSNRAGVRMMTKMRLGYVMLLNTVAKIAGWPNGAGCVMCSGGTEDVSHFLQSCPALKVCRERLGVELRGLLPMAGTSGAHILNEYERGGPTQLRVLLGGVCLPPRRVLEDEEHFAEQCALARWVLDKAVKHFLLACWRLRSAFLGDVQVLHGSAVVTPPSLSPCEVIRAQKACSHSPLPGNARQYWRTWLAKPVEHLVRRKRKKSPFYAVLRGRKTGVFYNWDDCARSVLGVPGAQFLGCQTLLEAEARVRAGVD